MVKQDLNEFTTTVKHDINEVASNDALFQNIPQKLQNLSRQLTSELGTVNNVTHAHQRPKKIPSRTKEAVSTATQSAYNRLSEELEALKTHEATYLVEPTGDEHHDYADWLANYDPDNNKGEISNLLIDNAKLRAIYSKLVPSWIFWSSLAVFNCLRYTRFQP
jgi:hypothetical protein